MLSRRANARICSNPTRPNEDALITARSVPFSYFMAHWIHEQTKSFSANHNHEVKPQ